MNQYVIMGAGNSSTSVIEDSLSDLPTPRTFHIVAEKTSAEGICRVYDWLLDNGEKYVAYHNGDAPTVLCDSAVKNVGDSDPYLTMLSVAKAGNMEVLYLWNDADNNNSTNHVTSLIDAGLRVIDLTQGLTPFRLVEDVKNDTVDSLPPVTRKEYEDMPIATLRQQAKAQGAADKHFVSKENIIDFLTGASEAKQVWEDDAVVVTVVYKDQTTKTFKSTVHNINLFMNK